MVRYSVMVRLKDDLNMVYITSILTESSYIIKKNNYCSFLYFNEMSSNNITLPEYAVPQIEALP